MNQENLPLVIDITQQENSAQILPHPPVVSSQKANWEGVFIAQYFHPAHEIAEHILTHHIIAIALNQFYLEVRKDGKFQHRLVDNGIIQQQESTKSKYKIYKIIFSRFTFGKDYNIGGL